MVSTDTVSEHHVKWRRGAALFFITPYSNPIELRPAKQKTPDLLRIAVIVEMNGSVRREERVELMMSEGMRVERF